MFPKKILCPNFGYFAPTFEPETIESQSKAQKIEILA